MKKIIILLALAVTSFLVRAQEGSGIGNVAPQVTNVASSAGVKVIETLTFNLTASDSLNFPTLADRYGWDTYYTVLVDTVNGTGATLTLKQTLWADSVYLNMNSSVFPWIIVEGETDFYKDGAILKYGKVVIDIGTADTISLTVTRYRIVAAVGGTAGSELDTTGLSNRLDALTAIVATKVSKSDSTSDAPGHYATHTALTTGLAGKATPQDIADSLDNLTLGMNLTTDDDSIVVIDNDSLKFVVKNYVEQGDSSGTAAGSYVSGYDFSTGLAGKQATLVSGTNIKTINSTSILGSGDLVVAGATSVPTYFIAANNATDKEKQIADALCDGTADQVQINAALVAGYNVKLSTGQFNIAAVITAAVANITLQGSGKQSTTIYSSNGMNDEIIAIGGNYWTIKDLYINGNDANNTGGIYGIWGNAKSNITIDNVEIYDIEDDGIFVLGACNYWLINNCYIHDCGTGIRQTENSGVSKYVTVSNTHIHNTDVDSHIRVGNDNVSFVGWNIDKCLFTGTSGYVYIVAAKAENVNVTNCLFYGSLESGGVNSHTSLRYFMGSSGTASGNMFRSAETGTDGSQTINIWGGKNVIISNNYFDSKPGANAIAVEGWTSGAYVGFNPSNIVIEGNTFYNINNVETETRNAVDLYAETGYVISDVNITGNVFRDDRGASSYCNYAITASGDGSVNNVSITNNIMDGLLLGGIAVTADTANNYLISGNQFIDTPAGIICDEGVDFQITDNKFYANTTPIDINDSDVTRPLIEGNTMYGCTNSGTYSGATDEIIGINLWHDGTYDNSAP